MLVKAEYDEQLVRRLYLSGLSSVLLARPVLDNQHGRVLRGLNRGTDIKQGLDAL